MRSPLPPHLIELAKQVIEAQRATRPTLTPELISDGHVPQLKLISDKGRNVQALCSRRAGKSTGLCGLMAVHGDTHPGTQLYFGRTAKAARLSIWTKIWRPLCDRYRLDVKHNDTMMITTFRRTGALVAFTGTDDVAHVETYLGHSLARAIIDEAQSQPPSVLDPLIERILPPALSDPQKGGQSGQLILAGTIPEVPAGTFYRLWSESAGWSKHNWSRFDNPHMGTPEAQMQQLAHYLETSGKTIDDPIVQRDWFGKFVFDPEATAYRYDKAKNGYEATPPAWLPAIQALIASRTITGKAFGSEPWLGVDTFSVAIDPGSSDRVAVQVWGWGRRSRDVQHVFDWATDRNANTSWSQIAQVLAVLQQHLRPVRWYYDAGSSKNELDTFTIDYGIPVIKAAQKSDLVGQVRRFNDLLQQGRAKVMVGSNLEEDMQKSRWDVDARARGQWKWSSHWHPDASEAARYALAGYFEFAAEPVKETKGEHPFAEEIKRREREAQKRGGRRREFFG